MTNLMLVALLGSLPMLAWALWPLHACRKRWLLGSAVFVMCCVGLAYAAFGGWRECRYYADVIAKQAKTRQILADIDDPRVIIRRLQKHLQAHPKAAKGWYLLGRLYAQQNQWVLATQAFSTAHTLRPHDEQVTLNLAQSLLATGNMADTKQARKLLKKVLAEHPSQADALALSAMDAYTHQSYDEAIDAWQRLLKLLPADSKEAKAIRRAIVKAQNNRGEIPALKSSE